MWPNQSFVALRRSDLWTVHSGPWKQWSGKILNPKRLRSRGLSELHGTKTVDLDRIMVGRFRNLGPTWTRTKFFQKNGGPTLPEIFDNKAWADQQTFLSPGADQDRNKISGRYAPDPSFPLTRSPCKTSVFPLSLCSVDRIYSFLTDHESRCGNSVFFSDFFRDFWNEFFFKLAKKFLVEYSL